MARIIRFAVFTAVVAASLHARVLSYAPYTDRGAIPAVQSRLNRHFVLVEQTGTLQPVPIGISPAPPAGFFYPPSQVVAYDSSGLEEPRVIFPQDGSSVPINSAIAYEDASALVVLIQTSINNQIEWQLTNDGGTTWKKVALPSTAMFFPNGADSGGPLARARFSQMLPGTREVPFVVAINQPTTTTYGSGIGTLYAVTFDGSVKQLATFDTDTGSAPILLGRDSTGQRFLVQSATAIMNVDVTGAKNTLVTGAFRGTNEGWITPDGAAFVEQNIAPGNVVLWYVRDGRVGPMFASWDGPGDTPPATINSSWVFFAVPTADYSGAWMIRRGGSRPTELDLYNPTDPGPRLGIIQWQDVSAPEVEALIPSQSGTKVLIQVHRPRVTTDNLMFKDPALAVWHVGDPAPASYDELFLGETLSKGFVHVDVDKIESGDQFVFDSGIPSQGGSVIISPAPPSAGGGSDVVQEWGVVRASLQQRLVLPGVGHTIGAFGSRWATDVTLYNPGTAPAVVDLLFAQNGISPLLPLDGLLAPPQLEFTLAAHEIRTIPDIVGTRFGLTNATGALFIAPQIGTSINVTSRTYNTTASGTYGFAMNGIDVYTAAGPRFPLTFSGAFEGDTNFRTNVIVVDTSSRGTSVSVAAAGLTGSSAANAVSFEAPDGGQAQFDSVGLTLGVAPHDTAALIVQPNRGNAITSVFVVDNRTNDPTFFPPDLPASVMRTIPAIGHVDGANGSKFRSDLYLFNSSSDPKTLTFQAKLWDVPEQPSSISFTLLPHESRVIRDALLSMFGKTGIAKLRFTLQGPTTDTSVRVTSRTYTIDPSGGTYGFQMPPLNSFQSGAPGDTLEILGARLDPKFRTNLGLVELNAYPNTTTSGRARIDIIDAAGQSLDSFEMSVPTAGGLQIDDLFHARNLPENGEPVLIRVTTIQGLIGAYGAFVDNGTNDPAYVAANLAARN